MYVTDLYSECVAGKLQFGCEPLSILNLLLLFTLMVSHYQVSLSSRQLLQAVVETVA